MTTEGPLHGRRIVVTRPEPEDGPLGAAIVEDGGEALHVPLLHIEPASFTVPCAADIKASDSIVFTSANGVRHFVRKLGSDAIDELIRHSGLAVVGPSTARALTDLGCIPAVIAHEHVAESLASELGDVAGQSILWPRGDLARDVFSETMRLKGALLTEIIVYRTVAAVPENASDILRRADAITFTSPSGVTAWVSAFGAPSLPVACIGPVTARAAVASGIEVAAVADPYTLAGLLNALREMLSPPPTRGTA